MRETVQNNAIDKLNHYITQIENILQSDVLTIYGDIIDGLEDNVNIAIKMFGERKNKITIILDTAGGVAEVVERVVSVIRNNYTHVEFIIPNKAMSSGTVFAMSGDRILMSDFSCLGPIDPQIIKDGKLIPALSYINQVKRLEEKADNGQFNNVDAVLLNALDLGELYQFEQASELSKDLLIEWLPCHLFKDLKDDQGNSITASEKIIKAKQIAETLIDPNEWRSHARMISRNVLISHKKLMLEIDRIEDYSDLSDVLENYMFLIRDFLRLFDPEVRLRVFVHTKSYI